MSEQDPAALVARARKLADWLRKMDDVSDDADLLNSLASALEAALAREGRLRGFGIPRTARSLAIAACDAVGLSSADDFDAVERAIEMELDVSNISQSDVAIVVVARAALEPRP